jgi:hypothetical protein
MISKCGKCEGTLFKVVTQEPTGSRYKINFVQCSRCSTPVGVLDYFNTGDQLEEQKKEIGQLKNAVANMDHMIRQIAQHLNQRR